MTPSAITFWPGSRSVPQIPTYTGLIATSPGPGSAAATSCRPIEPGPGMTSARLVPMRLLRVGAVTGGGPGLPGLPAGECGAAESEGDPVGRVPDRRAQLVHPPGRPVQLESRAADRGDAFPGAVVHGGAHAEHAVGVFLVVDRVAARGREAQVAQQRGRVGDRAGGPG